MKKKLNIPLYLGAFFILSIVGLTLMGMVYTPHQPNAMAVTRRFTTPSALHWFGTDQFGRDVLSRIMVGGQISLTIGLVSVSIGMAVGILLGALAGYKGKLWDEFLMRVADGFYAFPAFLLALLAVTIWGPGSGTAMGAIAVANIPVFMRITRANFLSLKQTTYIEAARALGASDARIIFRHILPNTLPPLLVQASVSFAAAVLAEASLSYLGVGTQPPMASWGRMLREAQSFAGLAPWTVIFPGLAIGITVLGFNLLGDGLLERGR